MANSLGTLTLDLIAKIGGFTGPLDQASRRSQKWAADIKKHAAVAGQAIAAASAVAAAAGVAWVKSTAETATEVARLAQISNAGTAEFQKAAFAAQSVGIEQDKLADIYKDVNDRVGEFLQTGAGPMKDFFENIAPLVGVTAEEFRALSGPQALGLYVESLEKAGLSQQELTFYLEAMASDTTALIPLLRDGGKGMADLATEAENLGLILSDETIAAAKQFNQDFDTLGRIAGSVGQKVAAELLPELAELTKTLKDPATADAAAKLASAVVTSFNTMVTGVREAVGFITWASESIAAALDGPAIGDIIRIEDRLDYLTNIATKYQEAGRAVPARISAEIDELNHKLEASLQLQQEAQLAAAAAEKAALAKAAAEKKAGEEQAAANERARKERAEQLKLEAAAEEARKKSEKAAEEAAKAAQRRADAIIQEIAALDQQVAVLGMSTKEQALYRLETEGATKAQLEQASALLDTIDAFEKQQRQQEAYRALVADLRTKEEQLTDQLKERLRIIEAMPDIPEGERREQTRRAVDAVFSDAPEFAGIDATIGGPAGELMKIDDAQEELEEWYASQLELLEKSRQERADLNAEWDAQELDLARQHHEQLANIEKNRQLVQLSAAESTFGSLAEMARTYAGESSGIYRALFAVEKGIAIARAAIAIQEGIALAAANPFPLNLAAMASVAAATGSLVGNIAAIGQAHDGIMSVPKSGTWNLEKGERVTTAETSAKLDATLERVQAGMAGGRRGGGPTNITINQPNVTNAREARDSSAATQRAVSRAMRGGMRYD